MIFGHVPTYENNSSANKHRCKGFSKDEYTNHLYAGYCNNDSNLTFYNSSFL